MPIGFDAQNAIQAFFFLNFFLENIKKVPRRVINVNKVPRRVRNVKKLPRRVSAENRGLGSV